MIKHDGHAQPENDSPESARKTPSLNLRKVTAALIITEICGSLEVTMVYTALPTLAREFGTAAGAGWIITACLLASAASSALCGRLGDLYGYRRVLLWVVAITFCGSLISALSSNLLGVTLGAGLQGVSGAILPLCLALVRDRFPPERVSTTIGLVIAAASTSAAIGLVLGGALIDKWGWQSIFWASGSWALISMIAAWFWLPRGERTSPHANEIDMVRGVMFAPAIAGLLLSLTLSKTYGFGDWRFLGTLFGSAGVLFYWARHQLAQPVPLINLRLLTDRRIATAYFCMVLVGLGLAQHTLLMSMMLQQPFSGGIGFGLAAGAAGAVLMPVRLIGIAGAPMSGKLAGWLGARTALLAGCALGILGWSIILVSHDTLPIVLTGMILEGLGVAFVFVAIHVILLDAAPPNRSGEVTGLSSVCRAAFTAVGAQITMFVLERASSVTQVNSGSRFPDEFAYQVVIGIILFCCSLCAISALTLPKHTGPAPT